MNFNNKNHKKSIIYIKIHSAIGKYYYEDYILGNV